MSYHIKSYRFFSLVNVYACLILSTGCSKPWVEEGTLPDINLYLEALKDEADDPELLLSPSAKTFLKSTFFLYVYEKSVSDPYFMGFDYDPVCIEFLKTNKPIAKSSTVIPLDKLERNARRRIYGYIPAQSWSVPDTGEPIGVLPGKDLLLCSTTEVPWTSQSQVFGTPTWLSDHSPNVQALFLDDLK